MSNPRKTKAEQKLEAELLAIAKQHFHIETLETRNMDRLDFHEVAVWGIRDALMAAYKLGQQSVK